MCINRSGLDTTLPLHFHKCSRKYFISGHILKKSYIMKVNTSGATLTLKLFLQQQQKRIILIMDVFCHHTLVMLL